tara:strand:+ start:1518 stop:1688 length:171 start_codon:yes stop_codon:yes gene_type:complete
VFGKFSFTVLFEKNKATELYPFSVGFTFGGSNYLPYGSCFMPLHNLKIKSIRNVGF